MNKLTYEMAVARAFLKATGYTDVGAYVERYGSDFTRRTYAMRRLRVRAGLTP